MEELISGDVIILQMDDELLMVHTVSADAGVLLVAAEDGFFREYEIDDVQSVYREIDMQASTKGKGNE